MLPAVNTYYSIITCLFIYVYNEVATIAGTHVSAISLQLCDRDTTQGYDPGFE